MDFDLTGIVVLAIIGLVALVLVVLGLLAAIITYILGYWHFGITI